MIVPKDYYEAEVRDGFYVPSEMKRCWAATVGVLEVIDRICKKHDIQYYAEYGTLLGAVRHGGFIPWDDDFDISMKREDYMVFLKVARDELPENYELLSVYNNPEYDNFLSRVVNRNFISLERDFLEENHNFPFAVGIDIFPLDYFDIDEKENGLMKDMILSAQAIMGMIDPEATDIDELDEVAREHIYRFCDMVNMPLESGRPIRQQIYILNERISSIYDSSAPYLANIYWWVKNGNQIFDKRLFENTVRLPFEFFEISAPIGYDKKLEICYGANYMTPYMGGGVHDYPLYGKQKKLLFETTGKNYYKQYEFDRGDLARPDVLEDQRSGKEIVFLPFKASYWPYMEKEWEEAIKDEEATVYVIPIPYYDKGVFGLNGDIHYEADLFPEYVPITPFDQYDFDGRIPDRIVIQNPYDQYDSAITVHPRFYTKELLQVTRELVYIPYFAIDEGLTSEEKVRYTADFYIKTPGVTRADKVLVHSAAVKELYVDKLCEFAGEETRQDWMRRIEVKENIRPETSVGIREEDIPEHWWKYLLDQEGEGKKVILFHTNVSDIVVHGEKYIEKLRRVLSVFKSNSERMTVIWHAHPRTQYLLEVRYPDLWEQYKDVLEKYLTEDYGIYEDSEDHARSVAISDAYYGDRDTIMHDFMATKRPIMIQNIEILS